MNDMISNLLLHAIYAVIKVIFTSKRCLKIEMKYDT